MNRTRWLWYMPSSAARKLSPGTPNTVSAPCKASCSIRICPPVRGIAFIASSFRCRSQCSAGKYRFADRRAWSVNSLLLLLVFRCDPRIDPGHGLIGLDDGGAGFAVVSQQRRLPVGLVHGLRHEPGQARLLQPARVIADVLAGVRQRHQWGKVAIEGCLAIEIEHAALGAGGRNDADHLREIEPVLRGKREPLAPRRNVSEGNIVVNELDPDGVPERADMENVVGIELEIGPEVVEQAALAP